MTDYNVEDRLITKDDWEKWLKMKEEYSDRHLSNIPEPSAKKESRYAVMEWHKYPQEKPPKDGLFLITHKFRNKKEVAMAYLTKDINSNSLMAWAKLPKPYEEEIRDE